MNNTLFSNRINIQKTVPRVTKNREYLIDKYTARELNTYLNFGVFPVFAETQPDEFESINGKWEKTDEAKKAGTPGVRSLFNRAGAVLLGSDDGKYDVDIINEPHWWRLSNNIPLIDAPLTRTKIRESSGCTIKELVKSSQAGLMGQETYSYSDFMFCKHLGKISNNYLITLRRFPLPVDDFIGSTGLTPLMRTNNASHNASCIGCMVTWMGVSGNSMENILKYSYNMPFREANSEIQETDPNDGDQTNTMMNGMFSIFDQEYRNQYQNGTAGTAANTAFKAFGIEMGDPPYKDVARHVDKNKVYGPVDVIKTTYMRSDAGLAFDQKITLVFEYELKAYNGINGKQAMLDLISNILNVTYTTGTFWGGGYRGWGAHQSNVFTNLNVFKARGGFTNFIDAFAKDVSTVGSELKNQFAGANGEISFGSILKQLNSIGGMLLSGKLNALGRPHKAQLNSLLSPAPVGFWHLTIGNPKRPIMSIGNMIITGCTIEHCGPLGLDDFPTGLKVTVELNRGKSRDLRDIEKLYMQGNDRIFTSMGEKVFDMYANSILYKKYKRNNDLKNYNPVKNIATIDLDSTEPTIKLGEYDSVTKYMKKYFGTSDTYSIYVPATEQEDGSGKKKPEKNK